MAKSKMRNVLLVLAFVFAAALCGAALLWQSPARASAEGDVPAVTGQAESVEGAVTLSDFAMKTGAEVRKSGIVGLRFTTNVSAADLALLPDNAVFGTLLLPETYLDGELTVDTEKVLNVPAERWYEVTDSGYTYTAVLIGGDGAGLEESFYGVDIVARAYVSYEDASGTAHVNYAADAQTRSAAYVASAALAAGESDEEGLLADIAGTVAKDFACAEQDLSLKVGASVTPEFTGDNGLVITYEVADPEVVAVENGAIKALAAGNTTVTASIGTAKVVLNVEVSAASLASETTDYELIYNSENEKSATLAVTADGVAADNAAIEWQSSAPEVVSVENGVITALASGEATVTASYQGGTLEFNVTAWQGIYTTADWQSLFAVKANLSGNYKLMADIAIDSTWSANNEQVLIYDLSVYNLTGKLDGNGHTIYNITSRLFNGVVGTFEGENNTPPVTKYAEVKDLTVVTQKLGVWGGIFGYQLRGAIVDNVTAYAQFGISLTCNDANRWGVAGAAAFSYEALYSTIKNSNIYITVPSDMSTAAWEGGPSNTADNLYAVAEYVDNTLTIENTNAYCHSEYDGSLTHFAGGFEMTVQPWDGVVEVATLDELKIFGNADLDIKLMDNITIDFGGTPYTTAVISTLNKTFDGNGHTITINAAHTDGAQVSQKNLIGTISATGVLTNATILYNLTTPTGTTGIWSANFVVLYNYGTMSELDVTINLAAVGFERNSGYLSYGGTGTFTDIDVRLAGVHHGYLRPSNPDDGAEWWRAGIVNATGEAATVNNLTIHYGGHLSGITEENVLGLLAPGYNGTVNNIVATNVTAVAD